ncbi:MAG: hypothetical protein HDS59_08345 [Barnesiella sp.]|nr:hypothetical protein [Barnesiella sp.]
MKKLLCLMAIAVCFPLTMYAESTDSCYVYKVAQWGTDFKGGFLVERVGDVLEAQTVQNAEGEKLRFTNYVTALNYYSLDGWELFSVKYTLNFDIYKYPGGFDVWLLRKKMPIDEAKKYGSPSN